MAKEKRMARGLRMSAILVAAGAILSGPLSMLAVSRFAPQPPWTDVFSFADHYQPLQALPYALGYILLSGFVLFAAACHAAAPRELRLRTAASLIFTSVYAALVFANYTIQIGFIPRMLSERPLFLAQLTMANPSSFAWFLEMFGYAALGAANWLVAPLFGGGRRGNAIRCLLVANGLASIAGAVCTALFDRWVFSPTGLASFMAWNALTPVCFGLIALWADRAVVDGQKPANHE